MKKSILSLMCLLLFPVVCIAGETSSLPFKELTAIVTIDKPYGEAKVIALCSSTEEKITRKFLKLLIKTKDKEYSAPETMLAKFNNPGNFMIHGGVDDNKEINFIFQYEKAPHRFTEGRINFRNGTFKVW
jgi:hypothetical protein